MENHIKTLILGIVLICFCSSTTNAQDNPSKSQTALLTVDLDKKTISGPFPFDEYINLNISSKKNKLIDKVELLKVAFVNGVKVPHDKRNSYRKNKAGGKVKEKLNLNVIPLKEKNDSTYTAILPPVLPNQMYELIFRKKFSSSQMSTFYEIIQLLSTKKSDKAKEIFDNKILVLDKEENREVPIENISPFTHLLKIHPVLDSVIGTLEEFHFTPQIINVNEINNISTKYVDKKIPVKNFSKVMFEYIHPINNGVGDIFCGIRAFSDNKASEYHDFEKRLKNVQSNLKLVTELEKELQKLIVLYPIDINIKNFYLKKITLLKTSLKNNKASLEKITKDIENRINKSFSYGEIITNSSITTSDKDGGLTYLESDVGFINALGRDIAGKTEYIGRLYLGLNWHIGGYNRNKRISQVTNKRIWYRFSVALGVTVGDIDEGGYTDLFNDISPSIGVNYRLAQDVRIGIGGMILRKDRNPIVKNESPEVLPYISATFNLKILKDLAIFDRIFNSQK